MRADHANGVRGVTASGGPSASRTWWSVRRNDGPPGRGTARSARVRGMCRAASNTEARPSSAAAPNGSSRARVSSRGCRTSAGCRRLRHRQLRVSKAARPHGTRSSGDAPRARPRLRSGPRRNGGGRVGTVVSRCAVSREGRGSAARSVPGPSVLRSSAPARRVSARPGTGAPTSRSNTPFRTTLPPASGMATRSYVRGSHPAAKRGVRFIRFSMWMRRDAASAERSSSGSSSTWRAMALRPGSTRRASSASPSGFSTCPVVTTCENSARIRQDLTHSVGYGSVAVSTGSAAATDPSHKRRGPRKRGGASSPRRATSSAAASSSQARRPPARPGSKRGRCPDPSRSRASTSSRAAAGRPASRRTAAGRPADATRAPSPSVGGAGDHSAPCSCRGATRTMGEVCTRAVTGHLSSNCGAHSSPPCSPRRRAPLPWLVRCRSSLHCS